MDKKIVVLGGGTGQSILLSGLKKFPFDITSIVSVCDDGKSTGKLRKEFNIPAMGDIRRVMISLAETEPLMEKLLDYRFETNSDLNEHTVGNLLLTAATQLTGNLSDGIRTISNVLNLKGKVIPLKEVNDGVFSEGIMGEGLAIIPENDILYAPVDAEVSVLMTDSRHACGLRLDNGMELLLHVGIDTVNMQGDGFEYLVKEGQKVKEGTPLIRFDRRKIKEAGHRDVTVCVITEGSEGKNIQFHTGMVAEEKVTIIAEVRR